MLAIIKKGLIFVAFQCFRVKPSLKRCAVSCAGPSPQSRSWSVDSDAGGLEVSHSAVEWLMVASANANPR